MQGQDTPEQGLTYDRQLLLGGAKRNAVLELWEVHRYGIDSHSDADYVSIYGMRPASWHAKGVRLLGRTAVECTRRVSRCDRQGCCRCRRKAPYTVGLLVDLFAGSGNTLFWLLRHFAGAQGIGFELDSQVFRLTQQNLAALESPINILNTDYRSGLSGVSVAADQLLIAFIAPPWGDALSKAHGLDLRFTKPPIAEIVDFLLHSFAHNPLLCAIQVHETVAPAPLVEVESRFDWSRLRVYSLNPLGENHGIPLGTKGWTP
ncbi:MAG TPA: hypothetical protein VNS63_27910 [Blastocatellia bacterium]|nr:hypothetical protein [Blastocatellia bacterium]